jgi:hypothetical protein
MANIDDWGYIEFGMFENMANGYVPFYEDRQLQALYDAALFNYDIGMGDRGAIIEGLRDYMWDEYGVDFDSIFDWESYREAYDRA